MFRVRTSGGVKHRLRGSLLVAASASLLWLLPACNRDERPMVAEPSAGVTPHQTTGARETAPESTAAPSASLPSEAGGPVAASRVTESGFELALQPSGEYRVGQGGEALIVLEAKAPFHVNDEYPYKFKLEPVDGVEYPQAVVGKDAMKLEKARATMSVKLIPRAAGLRKIVGRFFFSVCTEQKCLVEKRDLALGVEVR